MNIYKNYPYDVALSYAGEDHTYAEELADSLKHRGVKVFYDRYEKATLFSYTTWFNYTAIPLISKSSSVI